ncbi:CoA ester lyase [Amycolatopsis sp.]|jgi:citrate lyase subunit beta/citryl-CoA lyase|uniref:HpcH/HpaI aldolase/citrate lyase family protein n=1 Tax=Amycolatopsis sp. TaxID=37632 RepID=UPI002E04DBD7|nr:CoA ester lyase [Amycolatopsis sp.]
MTITPVRLQGPALLFCPADRPERVMKAAGAADSVIIDLEDAVAPERKATARDALSGLLGRLDPARTIVRVNATGTSWHSDDMRALERRPDVVVMLPMVATAADVATLAPRPVIALCETVAGVLEAREIARAANCRGLMWGSEDFVADLGGRPGRAADGRMRPVVAQARWSVLFAARAAALPAIDSVFVDITDPATLRADADEAADAGFSSKACIHPTQVRIVRESFRPTADEMSWARTVRAAAASEKSGAFQLDGKMIDAPVLAQAESIIQAAGEGPPEDTTLARPQPSGPGRKEQP